MTTTMTKPITREIIDDFAKDIEERKHEGPKPLKHVINFRNERRDGIERDVYLVATELLCYRKDNGRISSDIMNYEKSHGLLVERNKEAQKVIADFLKEKDKEKTTELTRAIEHDRQIDPAIITADGFLINGNRRKMVLEILQKRYPGDDRFTDMKVVILPGKNDGGGPPTLKEIEQIENRYQLQSEAKAEYYAFDRALSMRRKIQFGMSIEEQLRDDPIYAGLEKRKFQEEVKKCEKQYLKPLECIDRYLEHLGREGLYSTVSTGLGDSEGRWQAFLDYYGSVYEKLQDPKKMMKLGIEDDEVGKIEDVAFKVIRARQLPDLPKVHKIMRDMHKWLGNPDAKREFLKLVDIRLDLPKEERVNEDGQECDERTTDRRWGSKHAATITRQLKKARQCYEHKKGQESPMSLLREAWKKLNHENMAPDAVNVADLSKAMNLCEDIEQRASALKADFYDRHKNWRKFETRHAN